MPAKPSGARRRDLETAVNRIQRRERVPLLAIAAREWLNSRTALAGNTMEAYQHFVSTLIDQFGSRLAEGKSNRTVNFEVNTLRQILKTYGLWAALADRVKHLRERQDVGQAISADDEHSLLEAIRQSRSPALLPLFAVSIDAGLRASEIRSLRRKDLALTWTGGVIESGSITVPRSKTEAGTGRVIPLTRRACAILTLWMLRFPNAGPHSYLFPHYAVGIAGDDRSTHFHGVDLNRPAGEWKKAWSIALRRAGLKYRWHDLRHTFITRLLENPNVSEETIRALAGHVSKKMLERYSHIRTQAKQAAIAALEAGFAISSNRAFVVGGAQNWAQSTDPERLS